MITACNNLMNTNTINIIIVTDIFGINQHINTLVKTLSHHLSKAIKIIDPYNGSKQYFNDDEKAYQAFINHCGHQQYADKVSEALKQLAADTIVIGFSAGASAAWENTQEKNYKYLKHMIGFYPSQIRNQLDVVPSCEVTLIFPNKEPHFNLEQIIYTLSKNKNVQCIKTIYQHGFMNPSSKNYSAIAAQFFLENLSLIANTSDLSILLTKQKIHFNKEGQ